MDIFTVLFYQPLFNLLVVFYRLFGENLGLAIILIALLSRLITLPITLRQTKMMKTGQEMNEKLKDLKKKYKNDKEKLQQETMKLQSEYLPAQLSGCLPAILQFIFFINIYNVINNLIVQGTESFNVVAYSFVQSFDASYALNTSFFGLVDLKTTAGAVTSSGLEVIPYLVLIALVGITQYYSMKILTPPPPAKDDSKSNKKSKKDVDAPEDFSEILQQSTRQTALLFPFMVALISYNLASGLSLYWISQSGFVIIQQFALKRLKKRDDKPPLVKVINTKA
jgi:YidC/Oxa1 family membrane protein insertase